MAERDEARGSGTERRSPRSRCRPRSWRWWRRAATSTP